MEWVTTPVAATPGTQQDDWAEVISEDEEEGNVSIATSAGHLTPIFKARGGRSGALTDFLSLCLCLCLRLCLCLCFCLCPCPSVHHLFASIPNGFFFHHRLQFLSADAYVCAHNLSFFCILGSGEPQIRMQDQAVLHVGMTIGVVRCWPNR